MILIKNKNSYTQMKRQEIILFKILYYYHFRTNPTSFQITNLDLGSHFNLYFIGIFFHYNTFHILLNNIYIIILYI